jgi:hypothetical protein
MRNSTLSLCLMLSVIATTARAQSPTVFPIPSGFVDLKRSPGAVEALERPEEYLAAARALDVYALKIEDGEVVVKLGAKAIQGHAPMDQVRKSVEYEIASNAKMAGAKILSSGTVLVSGVECERVVFEHYVDGAIRDQLTYGLPKGEKWVLASVDIAHDRYAEESRRFEELLTTVPGIARNQPAETTDPGETTAKLGLLLCVMGLGGWIGRARRRKRARPTKR